MHRTPRGPPDLLSLAAVPVGVTLMWVENVY